MKRRAWLLVLPYIVIYHPNKDFKGKVHEEYSYDVVYSSTGKRAIWDCFGKEACEDIAYLMNEAHERRNTNDPGIISLPKNIRGGCLEDEVSGEK